MKVAINIKTDDWNKIINGLVKDGWRITSKYEGYDRGIDFDFLILRNGSDKVFFGWENWLEGEIKCSDRIFTHLAKRFDMDFTFGKPNSLKLSVIILTRLQNLIYSFVSIKMGRGDKKKSG